MGIEVVNAETFKAVSDGLKEVSSTRIDIQKRGKLAREDAIKFQKEIIAAENYLVQIIDPVESALKEKSDNWKQQEEQRKAAKRERLLRIERAIAEITALTGTLLNANSQEIKAAHNALKCRDFESEGTFQEYLEKAEKEKGKALEAMQLAFDRAVAAEEQAKMLVEMKAQQAEFARQKAEFEDQQRQAELSKQAAENARLQAEKDKLEAEANELRKAEAKRKAEEQERIAAEAKAAAEKLEEERQAALRPDYEKLINFAESLSAWADANAPTLESEEAREMLQMALANIKELSAKIIELN